MNVSKIDYEAYREKIKSFFKKDPKYKDFNFEASGLSTFINMLAYNAHYLGAYAYMLNNESSIDSAQTTQSVYSKSRGLGYTPKQIKASTVEVRFQQEVVDFPDVGYVVLHRGKKISATSSRIAEARYFTNMSDVYCYDYEKTATGSWIFTSPPTVLFEGSLQSWDFEVDKSVLYQSFIIKDKTADIDSLRVYVKNTVADEGVQYNLANSVINANSNSDVFYTSITSDGYIEIYFGNDVFGKQPQDSQIIHCEYMSCNGENGNGCTDFVFAGWTIIPSETSNSGSQGETIETTRFNAINFFKSQNRLLLPDDYRSHILSYFRNLQAINVWRGEDNYIKQYGKIFISVKPYFADRLSNSAKTEISEKLLEESKKLGAEPIFVDPEFIECYVDFVLTTDINKTSVTIQSIENKAIDAANTYNSNNLNVFDNTLSDVDLNYAVKSSSSYIKSVYNRKTLQKAVTIDIASTGTNTIYFGNDLVEGSISSSMSIGKYQFNLYDEKGIIYASSNNLKNPVLKAVGTVDYDNGKILFKVPVSGYKGKVSTTWKVTPKNPDIRSMFNNIVRIARVRVIDE